MSDLKRHLRPDSIGTYSFSVLALIGILILLYSLGVLNGREKERRYQSPHTHLQNAKSEARATCFGLGGDAAFECIYEKVESSEQHSQNEQDLSAQQRAANDTLVSAIVAIFTLVVSIFGVFYVKRTLDATLSAVQDTREATNSMVMQTEIADRSQRPWLALEVIQLVKVWDGEFVPCEFFVQASFKNVGRTPAIFVDTVMHVAIIDGHVSADDIVWGSALEKGGAIVGPGQSIGSIAKLTEFNSQTYDLLIVREKKLVCRASAVYCDFLWRRGAAYDCHNDHD